MTPVRILKFLLLQLSLIVLMLVAKFCYLVEMLVGWFCYLLRMVFAKLGFFSKKEKVIAINGNINGQHQNMNGKIIPKSVNFHYTRKCNYDCGFCFHTAKTSFVLPIEVSKEGLRMLKDSGMEKINFSGGEPFIHDNGNYVGQLVKYCKLDLQLPSVSIVSNGSLVGRSWFRKYGEFLDILAISCDSFDEETNKTIGRGSGRNHVSKLRQIGGWCDEFKVAFKINTVVNTYNKDENMVAEIQSLNPMRWKVFQCLLLEGENAGEEALRNAEPFYITDEEFEEFLQRHKSVKTLVPESNIKMKNSYLILDEQMRFLDCRDNKKIPSNSILDVGVDAALDHSGFDEQMFLDRGGVYVWSKKELLDQKYEW